MDAGLRSRRLGSVWPVRVAALDLGSSSFRLVVTDWVPGVGLVPRLQRRERLNLGMVVGREGRIPEPHAVAAVKAVARLRACAEQAGADRVVAVATSALRDARNRESMARRLSAAAGVPVTILSGDQEAALTFAAMRSGLPLGEGRLLGLDLGGGSLELAVGAGDRLEWTSSLPLGGARLVGSFMRHDPINAEERAQLAAHVAESLAVLPGREFWPAGCAASGGTIKSLARLSLAFKAGASERGGFTRGRGRRPASLRGVWLPAGHIDLIAERLLAMGPQERRQLPGMDRRRADVLGAGALVVGAVLRGAGLDGVTVSEWGLREGVILEALAIADVGRRYASVPVP